MWGTLHALDRAGDTLLWNAYPWHPHRPGVLQSNRTPTPAERRAGLPVLEALLAALPQVRCFAVGRNAEASLAEVGIRATPLAIPRWAARPRSARACGARWPTRPDPTDAAGRKAYNRATCLMTPTTA